MSQHILAAVQEYLRKAQEGPVEISDQLIEEFGEACKAALKRQLSRSQDEFRLRMSNIGRPLCQLKLESDGLKGETQGYHTVFRNLFGDLIEAAAIAVMKAAGVNINSQFKKVRLPIGDTNLIGTYDVEIDDKIYDIKSASPYSFTNTFGPVGSFAKLAEDDHFGYVAQGYGYSEAEKKPFGGWIVINKSTGEWEILAIPDYDDHHREAALKRIDTNIRAINNKEPFKREFTDHEETFNKKSTGNRILGSTCSFCQYRQQCWPNSTQQPQALSKAKRPRLIYYSEYKEELYGTPDSGAASPGVEAGNNSDAIGTG